jgi:O-methyltransferase involved in polyketide biosynthesis
MKHKISLKKIKGVLKMLLIPLRCRYLETKRNNGIVDDPKSAEIIDSTEHGFTEVELPWIGQIIVSARTENLFDRTTKISAMLLTR